MGKIAHHLGIEARIAIKAIKERQQTDGFKTLADGHADQLGRYGNRDGGNDDIESFGPAIGRHQKAAAVHFDRSEEHTSELQSLMRISYAVFCLKKKTPTTIQQSHTTTTQHLH